MKILKFRQKLAKQILNGEKNTTWRLFDDKNISQGDELQFVVWETDEIFANAVAVSVVEKKLRELTDKDLEGHEKFNSKGDMLKTYSEYYGKKLDEENTLKVIKFKINL